MIKDNQMKAASERVKKSGVLELLAKWEAQDHPDYRQGGRPRIISAHAILVGLILLEQKFASLFMRLLSNTFQTRMSPAARAMLDLPEPGQNRSRSTGELRSEICRGLAARRPTAPQR